MKWLYLLISIVGEIIATSALKESNGFTKVVPAIISAAGYSITFYFLSLTLREVSVGIVYAIWSGVGIVLISIVGYLRFNQKLDTPAIVGMFLIISGVIIINLFSKTTTN